MARARRVGRWVLYGLAGLLVLVILVRVGIGIYLATPAGRAMVARQIAERIGMRVEVQSVSVGLFTSSISMRLLDPAVEDPANSEVLAVEDASADVSLFGVLRGRVAPSRVELQGVNLTLHVTADGDVVTSLPKSSSTGEAMATPVINLTGGSITIQQEGRPRFTVENLNLEVTPTSDGGAKLSGTIDDPQWSKWTVGGQISGTSDSGFVELATPDGPLTMDRLGSIPFVPPAVWDSVRPDGRGAVKVRVWSNPGSGVEYSVDILPAAATLGLPVASVALNRVTGLIRVTGAEVDLEGTRAELAGGTIAVDGKLDFGNDPTVMNLKVSGEKLDTRKLPPEWNFPKEFEGKLKGNAELVLKIHDDGRIEPDGGGAGVVTGVKVLGFQGDDIPINLRTRGDRYQFTQPKSPKIGLHHARPRDSVRSAAAGESHQTEALGKLLTTSIVALQPPLQPSKQDDKKQPPRKTDEEDEETTLDATIRLRDIEIAELLDKLKVKLDYKIAGKITVEAAVEVPLAGALSQSAYQFSGSLSSPALHFEGLTVRKFSAKMTYRDGKLTLTDLSGTIDQPDEFPGPSGTFRGTASAAVDPPGVTTASFDFDRVPLGEVLQALPGFTLDVRGTVSGKVAMRAPYEKLWDATLWSGSGELTSKEIVFEGRSAKDIRLAGEVAKGFLTLKNTGLTLEGIAVTADGRLALDEKYAFSTTVRTSATNVTDLRKLVPEVEIPAPVEGVLETETKVKGTLSPLAFTATGTVNATRLTLGRSTANRVAMKWELTRDELSISELKADAFGGSLTASAHVPFDEMKAGKFAVAFEDFNMSDASELVPDFPVRISGKVSGKVSGDIPPARPGEPRVGNLEVNLTAPKLTVQGIPAERLVGKGSIRGGTLRYELEGKTLGGSFEIRGRYPGGKRKLPQEPQDDERGAFRLRGLDLSRIATDVGFRSLAPLRGRLDANFEFENDFSAGAGRVTITRLQWGEAVLVEQLTGFLTLRDGVLEMPEVNGRLAGGALRARARVRFPDTSQNFFVITLNGADADDLLSPFPDLAGILDGRVTVVIRGQLGRETRASGTVTMPRGTASGVQVSGLRIPFEFATSAGGLGRFSVRDVAVNAGSGRVRAELTANWGYAMRVEGKIRFTDVPLRTISPAIGESSFFGNGRITGRFDLGGRNVRSVDDLSGTLVARLNNTSVKEIPILQQTTRFLNPSGLVKPFEAGDVRANLRNGVFHIQRLALANPAAQLFAEGTINTSGRVDLDVVAHTGRIGPEVRALRLFGLRLPAIGPLPVTLIRDVSDFLSNRTIRMTITGTTSNPIVRVNVRALLTEQAVRFFVTRYVLPADVAGTLGVGSGIYGSMNDR